jgi:hypothetical protein
MLTAAGYHDADRRYSLTYLSDIEMENIKDWVSSGGVLIAGDNIGRNTIDGNDRAVGSGKLNSRNWVLSDVFGCSFSEENMKDYKVEITGCDSLCGKTLMQYDTDEWTLVVDSVFSSSLDTIALWKGKTTKPASVLNRFGKGKAVYLSTSYMLHPANYGGLMGIEEIEHFYQFIINSYFEENAHIFALSPWKNGAPAALSFSFNADGTVEEIDRLIAFFNERDITPEFFVTNTADSVKELLMNNDELPLASSGLRKQSYSSLNYTTIRYDIVMNEEIWQRSFEGFKFPFSRYSFWGMYILDELGYSYESSIPADNLNGIISAVYPYNVPVAKDGFYTVLDLLELSPVKNDDYFFYSGIIEDNNYTESELAEDALIFSRYLINQWNYGVKPYGGAMIFIGDPMYSAHNPVTLTPMDSLMNAAESDNAWICTLDELAQRWNIYSQLQIRMKESDNQLMLTFILPEDCVLEDLALKFDREPLEVSVFETDYSIKGINGTHTIILDVKNNSGITITFEEAR